MTRFKFEQLVERVRKAALEQWNGILALRASKGVVEKFDVGDDASRAVRAALVEAIDADILRYESEHSRLVEAEARRVVGEIYGSPPTGEWASFVLDQGFSNGVSATAKNRFLSVFDSLRRRPSPLDLELRAMGGGVVGRWECRGGEWLVGLFVHEDGSLVASAFGSRVFLVSFEVNASAPVGRLAGWIDALENTPPRPEQRDHEGKT